MDELIKNKGQLINVEFDPYGVTFPPKYYLGKDVEIEKKVIDANYEEILKEMQLKYEDEKPDDS